MEVGNKLLLEKIPKDMFMIVLKELKKLLKLELILF
jgi:hypothetical protein